MDTENKTWFDRYEEWYTAEYGDTLPDGDAVDYTWNGWWA